MNDTQYEAGSCNIGKEEVTYRKVAFYFGALLSILAVTYFFMAPPNWARLGIVFSIIVFTAINFQQYRNQFCIKYGWLHQFNFGKRGMFQTVSNKNDQLTDRKKVIYIVLKSVIFAAVVSLAIYFAHR